MPFWKQSEDPWDRKPDKPRAEPKDPQANPLDSLKSWNEERKAKAKEKEAAKRLPREKCPWCGKDMEQGFLATGRDPVRWYSGVYKFEFFRGLDGNAIDVLNDGSGFTCYKITWLCRECKKMVFDVSDALDRREPFTAQPNAEETKEEERSEE